MTSPRNFALPAHAAVAPQAEAMRPKLAILLTASVGCAMTVLDTNIVAIILPTVARRLGADFADVEWVISTYVLCFAALLLPAGSIADRFGRKRVFLGGIGLFAFASLCCGAAPTAFALYVARALQGVGAAFLLAPALAIIGHAFNDPAERAHAWSVWGGVMGITMVVAPILGGVIAFLLGWRWAFYVNVPICIGLGCAALALVPESRDDQARRLDPAGIVLFAGTMFGVTWGLIQGQAHGWLSPHAVAGFAGGLLSFACFCRVETRQARPMLDLSLFRSAPFIGAVLAMFAYAATAQVMAQLLPLYLQNGLGRAPLVAGISMLPFALGMLILPYIGRRLGHFLASHHVLALGLALVSAGDLLTSWAAYSGHAQIVVIGMALLGSGGGLLNGETQKAIMGAIPKDRAGMASGISTTARFSGILLGFAMLSAILGIAGRFTLALHAQAALTQDPENAQEFAQLVVAGNTPTALRLMGDGKAALATQIAHQGYSAGFAAALLFAAMIAAIAAMLVAILMRRKQKKEAAF
ncbi:MAG TPA: MFS transporter [Acidocella sp.]|jgi:EmrB/QacA subfamily drug resistance transporter|uniref:MFS transporter n=1 Tax=Acidocella sp. TaxID=50710 RepID=UPI002C1723B3|nr:MFS transporter [Acidocella sp.]HVE20581.1 MFS transporter [Acidocella sp.]